MLRLPGKTRNQPPPPRTPPPSRGPKSRLRSLHRFASGCQFQGALRSTVPLFFLLLAGITSPAVRSRLSSVSITPPPAGTLTGAVAVARKWRAPMYAALSPPARRQMTARNCGVQETPTGCCAKFAIRGSQNENKMAFAEKIDDFAPLLGRPATSTMISRVAGSRFESLRQVYREGTSRTTMLTQRVYIHGVLD